ncbi:ZIP family metal transporter [Caballeronia cordobensis]|uniref:ZIP family metal transporter n=1 Tax=Caballeronia cordobensis TaxID=1353886 RepID=UPI00045EE0B0|nr:uncharacterized protein BRPE67_DCDS00740 [Burkholderia sp. RPE67]
MTPAVKLALLALPPVLAAAAGAAIASARKPGARTTSVIQHFTAGIVFAAAALELLPEDRKHALWPVVMGFALGLGLMLGIKAVCNRLEARLEGSTLPAGLVVVTAVDLIIDGLVLGIAFAAAEETGVILTIALTLEVLFLALSVSTALSAAGVRSLWAIVVPIALSVLLSASAVAAHAVLANLPSVFVRLRSNRGDVAELQDFGATDTVNHIGFHGACPFRWSPYDSARQGADQVTGSIRSRSG